MDYSRMKYVIGCLFAAFLAGGCTEDNEGGTGDEHWLKFEIPEVPVTSDYTVGAFYLKSNDRMSGGSVTAANRKACWARLTGTGDFANYEYDVCPKETPVWGDYDMKTNDVKAEDIDLLQEQMDTYAGHGIDFLILPSVSLDINNSNELTTGDVEQVKVLVGKIGEGKPGDGANDVEMNPGIKHVNFPMKYACSVNVDNITKAVKLTGVKADGKKVSKNGTQLSNTHLIEDSEAEEDWVQTLINGEEVTRVDLLNILFALTAGEFFDDPNYMKVDGKPMVVIENSSRLFSKDSKALYDGIRSYVREQTGYDMYLVAKSGDAWCPPDRYEYFYLRGGVDALTSLNMYNGLDYTDTYNFYPQAIYLNMQYTREYIAGKYGIDFIPTGGIGFNRFVENGDLTIPIVKKDPDVFRRMCNIMKGHAGTKRIVFLQAVNEYKYDSFLDPTVERGDLMLSIVKEQFKK